MERLDAHEAVAKYNPEVVVASWVTQKYAQGDEEKHIGSSMYGVDELTLLRQVKTYIHIGNLNVHRDKRILALPHQEFTFPWLWSRSMHPTLNRIWLWDVNHAR